METTQKTRGFKMKIIKKYNMKEQDKKKLFSFNEVREIVRYYEKIAKQDFADKIEKELDFKYNINENKVSKIITLKCWKQLKKEVLK